MAPKPPSSDEPKSASGDDSAASELDKKLLPGAVPADRSLGDKAATSAAPDDDDEDDELDLDDEDDEDLVVFTAKEAAGALATIYAFVRPFLANYKRMLTFVSIGVVIETLFNVIMPLSLKFLIDDALGEEDFHALYVILGVLAVAGIFTSIVATSRPLKAQSRALPTARPCRSWN
jgi:ATP-binding cassette subfamily B protein